MYPLRTSIIVRVWSEENPVGCQSPGWGKLPLNHPPPSVTSLAPVTRDTRDGGKWWHRDTDNWQGPVMKYKPLFPAQLPIIVTIPTISLSPLQPTLASLPNCGYGCRETLHNLFPPHPSFSVCHHHIVFYTITATNKNTTASNYPKLERDFDWIQH